MVDISCPTHFGRSAEVTLADGSGGKSMYDLIHRFITPIYGQGFAPDHDGAVLNLPGKVAFTTDSFVVKPLFFPGGDIGKLAVYGTINDLAMCGAIPRYLSCSFIIEEGFSLDFLERICASIGNAAKDNDVSIVTGDTKVVGRGQADGIYINTSGVGTIPNGVSIHPAEVEPGDLLIVSGDLGRHGISIMCMREGFLVDNPPESDCAPLVKPVAALIDAGIRPKCLRDLTRGGLAAALHEIAMTASVGLEISEENLQVESRVRGACEMLGLDPLYVANEGRFVAIVAPRDAAESLSILRSLEASSGASLIGRVTSKLGIEIVGAYGSRRMLPPFHGELLPRIC